MIQFPSKTEYNLRLSKQSFYENIKISPVVKRLFVEQIKKITWKNKISADTLSVDNGKIVEEIQLIEIELYKPELDISVLRTINSGIPYNLVFLLTCEDNCQLAVFHSKWFFTEWKSLQETSLRISGRSLDDIWDGFVQQIGNITISDGRTLDEQIAEDERVAKLKKEIEKLERMAKSEVQPKRKFELHQEMLKLKKEI